MSVSLDVLDEAILDVLRQDPTSSWTTTALFHQPKVQGALGLLGAFAEGDGGARTTRSVAKLWVARFINRKRTPNQRDRYQWNSGRKVVAKEDR